MKKLLLLISFSGSFIFASCQNSENKIKMETVGAKTENPSINMPAITAAPLAIDTAKGKKKKSSSGTVGIGTSTPKKTTSHHIKGKAITHSAPNQTKIDSIKNVQGKTKK